MKRILTIACVVFAAAVVLSACEKMQNAQVTPQNEQPKGALTNETGASADVAANPSVSTVQLGANCFSVEVAKTDEERAAGLQNRESLPEKAGMWFEFPTMAKEKFWMKDTQIPLDVAFIDDNMKVIAVYEDRPAMSVDTFGPEANFKYVIEVNAGTIKKLGVKVGDEVKYSVGPSPDCAK